MPDLFYDFLYLIGNIIGLALPIVIIVFFLLYNIADFRRKQLEKFIDNTLTNSTN